MKKYIVLLLILIIGLQVFSQNLQISEPEDITGNLGCAESTGEGDACITFLTIGDIRLGFESNVEKINISSERMIGENREYILTFNTDNHLYNLDRVIQITSKESPQALMITPILRRKQSLKYIVSLIPCALTILDSASIMFNSTKYAESKELIEQAKNCYDYVINEDFNKKALLIDSIIMWMEKAKIHEKLLEYNHSVLYYRKILTSNKEDKIMEAKLKEMIFKNEEFCRKYYKRANTYFKEHEFEKAKILYQKVVDLNCWYKDTCLIRAKQCDLELSGEKPLKGVFTVELGFASKHQPALLLPFGIHAGGYKNYGIGGYWSMSVNNEFFNMLLKDYDKAIHPEIGMQVGLNIRPSKNKYYPIWLHWGAGYHFIGRYTYNNSQNEEEYYDGGELPESELTIKPYHTFVVEMGTTIKIKRLALRYTFQHRFARSDRRDFVIPNIHSIGIGICW